MNREQFKMLAGCGMVAVVIGAFSLPASAEKMPSSHKVRVPQVETIVSETNSTCGDQAINLEEKTELSAVQTQIGKIDDDITECLAKITQYENLKSKNKDIARLYEHELKVAHRDLNDKELELSRALRLQQELTNN